MSTSDEKVFDVIVEREGKFTFVAIPFSPAEAWGAKPRYYVAGTINDFPVRGTLGALGQDYFLRLGAAWMRDSALLVGDRVTVRLSLEGPQEENLAPDVVQALSENPRTKEFFDGLPTFYRKNYIRWIESAKREETRARRIAEMLALLSKGKREK